MQQIAHERLLLGFETILILTRLEEDSAATCPANIAIPSSSSSSREGDAAMDVRGATFSSLPRATKQRRHLFRLERPRGRARESRGTCPRPPVARGASVIRRRSERHAFDEGVPRANVPSAKTPPAMRGGVFFSGVFPIPTSRAGSVFFSGVFPIPASRGDVFPISTRAGPPRAPAIASPRAATAARAPRSRSSSPSRPRRARASSDPT